MNAQLNKLFNESTKMPIMVGVVSFAAGVGVTLGVSYIRNRKNSPGEIYPHKVPTSGKIKTEDLDEFVANERRRLGIGHETDSEPKGEGDDEGKKESGEEISQSELSEIGKDFVEETLETIALIPEEPSEETSELESRNVFAGSDDEWDYETELKRRTTTAPYILHKDEFYADELNYAQITLTYYAGDDILVDEEEAPIYNHNQIVGPMKFGHGSGDPNVFHVRNDKRRAEYEIIKDPEMYSVEVLGLSLERSEASKDLRHSHHTPRFHMD